MISREHRFHGQKGLRYVYQNGRSIRDGTLSLKWVLNPRRRGYRLAVVVSRKVEKSAVKRNRLRRRLYATVRQFQDDIVQPYDMVITVFSNDLLGMSPTDLAERVENHLQKAGILAKRVKG